MQDDLRLQEDGCRFQEDDLQSQKDDSRSQKVEGSVGITGQPEQTTDAQSDELLNAQGNEPEEKCACEAEKDFCAVAESNLPYTDTSEETSTPEEDSTAPALAEALAQSVLERLDELEKRLHSEINRRNEDGNLIDKLYNELNVYKKGLHTEITLPLLRQVIEIRDSVMTTSAEYSSREEGAQAIPLEIFASYADDLLEILRYAGIEEYRSESGEVFNPRRQRAIAKTDCEQEELHGVVERSYSSGYLLEDKVLTPEKVRIFKYVPPKEVQPSEAQDTVKQSNDHTQSANPEELRDAADNSPLKDAVIPDAGENSNADELTKQDGVESQPD